MDGISEHIILQLKLKLEVILSEAIRSGVDIRKHIPKVKLGIIEKISTVDLTTSFSGYS
jgi:hypothetical protein